MSAPVPSICLIGPGRVGTEVLKAVRADTHTWRLHSVVVRERGPEAADLDDILVRSDGDRAVIDSAVDVVVDATSNANVAFPLLRAALHAGKAAVSANKDLAVRYGGYLRQVASTHGGSFGYDAAVCAALPITTVLHRYAVSERITAIDGLFSGTCNFVLGEMAARQLSLVDAIAEAQQLGYTEPDATSDLNALDAARKTALIAELAWGQRMDLAALPRLGIEAITPDDLARATDQGQVIRLASSLRLSETGPVAWVAPTQFARSHPFAGAVGNDNILRIRADGLGTITLHGAGAGPIVTAAALISDAHYHVQRRLQITAAPAGTLEAPQQRGTLTPPVHEREIP